MWLEHNADIPGSIQPFVSFYVPIEYDAIKRFDSEGYAI